MVVHTATIELTGETGKNLVTLVDENDYANLMRYKWYPRFASNTIYVTRYVRRKNREEEGSVFLLMHRSILGAPKTCVVDHINGNGLDNRRENIRCTTASGNQYNKRQKLLASTGIQNVYIGDKRSKHTYYVNFDGGGRDQNFGTYRNIKMAEKIACLVRQELIIRAPEIKDGSLLMAVYEDLKTRGELNVYGT